MTAAWCNECLELAINRFGNPEIINTDKDSQFSSTKFTSFVLGEEIRFSMDGRGRAIDNIFIERFWRNIKYEKKFLGPSDDGLSTFVLQFQTLHKKNLSSALRILRSFSNDYLFDIYLSNSPM